MTQQHIDFMLSKIPMGRFLQPVEAADLILFLASSTSAMITGESIFIDGGSWPPDLRPGGRGSRIPPQGEAW
jgi:NAD(P)-dependent dehydrogenase (short-subunit alcohol dehydrogenase family)